MIASIITVNTRKSNNKIFQVKVRIMDTRKTLSFAVVLVLGLWALCGPAWAIEDMISHWKFDEGEGSIAHDSEGTNDGTIYGAAWATGQIEGALSFDGMDDYVNVIDSDGSLDIENNITITAWIRLNDLSDYYFIVGKQPTGTSREFYPGNYEFRTRPTNGCLDFNHQTGTGDYEHSSYTSTSGIEAGTWHHVSVSLVEGGNVNFYVDGAPAGTVPQSGTFGLINDEPVRIGTRKDGWSYFNGLIDDVRIYDIALSAEEIQELYLNGVNNLDFVIIQLEEAIIEKIEALEKIDAALEKEWTAYEALEELLESGDYGDLKKGDIIKAMQKVHSAIQIEELSKKALKRSIDKLLYSLSALGYGPQPPGSNWPPYVTITTPLDGAEFNPDDTIEIEVDALDFDGSVVMVEFFADGSKIGEDNDGADGWTTSWSDHPEGTYSLTATATDNEAAATTSPEVVITVVEEPPPIPPPPVPPPPRP
jgi:hypothetical protein